MAWNVFSVVSMTYPAVRIHFPPGAAAPPRLPRLGLHLMLERFQINGSRQ